MGSPAAGVDPNAIDPNAVGGDSNAIDPNATDPLGFGGDPIGLGGNMGFAGGGDVSGGGRGPDTSAASVANTQLQAPYDIQAGGGLRSASGGPATDQPQPQRYASASAALMGGPQQPGTVSDFSGKGGTPDSPRVMEPWAPSPNTNLAQPDSFNERFNATTPNASFNERFNAAQPATPDGSRPYSESNVGGLPAIPRPYPPESNVGGLPAIPSQPQPSGPVPTPQPRPDLNLPTAIAPPATPPAATPTETATGGQGVSGPSTGPGGQGASGLEQIIGQFLRMLGIGGGGGGGGMGGILSPMEHMLARALGINLPQPYPGFNPGFHSPFFQQPGPGQFPAGTTGGRPPLSQFQPPGAPRPWPGTPGAPGTTPSALPRTRSLGFTEEAPGAAEGQTGDATQYIRDHGGHPAGVGAPDLNPEIANRLARAGRAYEQETGQKPNFGEMGRSNALQRQYYQEYRRTGQGLAAAPGTSRHERGLATDVPRGPFQDWLHRNAARFGLEGLSGRAGRMDPAHFQMTGGPGAPASASAAPAGQRSGINPGNYERTFAGSPLAGQSEAITRAAIANGVPPARMASIIAFETGRGQSHMLRAMNNPAGITRGGQYVSFPTIQEGIDAAGRAIGRVYQQTGGDIGRMARIYAPVGARNDPYGTNRQWPGSVMRFEQSLGM